MTNILMVLAAAIAWQQAPSPTPRTAFDSTTAAIVDVGHAVADVKAEADRFRTRAFNDPIGSVLESATAFRAACRRLVEVALKGRRVMCRACVHGGAQPAFNRYAAGLPDLASLGRRCEARLRANVTPRSDAAALHREALALSNLILSGLRPYERRVADVRAALATPARRRR